MPIMILSPVSNFGDQSLYSMLSLWQFEKLSQSVPRDTTHMWYVNGAWLIISSAQFVLEHLYLIFHPIFPVRWKLSPLLERCCDILFKYAIVIWTTLTVRCRPFEHNKVHHPCCKLRVKRGVGQIYIVQSKQALPINYNHGTLEEGKKEESIKEKHLVNELMLTAIVCDRFREIKSKGNLQHHAAAAWMMYFVVMLMLMLSKSQ